MLRTIGRLCAHAILVGVIVLGVRGAADAGVIRSPGSVLSNSGGEFSADYSITNSIDHSGLSTDFTSGVTDFDTYLGGNPIHTLVAFQNEWFSPQGVHDSTIVYDMGAEYSISRLALWNEDYAGLLTLDVSTSNDPTFTISTLVGSFSPADNLNDADYGAEVFNLLATTARYIQFVVTGPQIPAGYDGVSIGEVAFDTDSATAPPVIPEPGTLTLAGLGAAFLAGAYRRRSKK